MFEVEFVNIVLGFKGQNLVLSLFRASLTSLGEVVELFDSINDAFDLTVESVVYLILDILLFTANVDLFAEVLVLALEVVETCQCLVKLVFKTFDLGLVGLHGSCTWSVLFEALLLVLEFFLSVSVLVFEDHEAPKFDRFMLEQGSNIKLNVRCSQTTSVLVVTYFFSCSNFLVKLSASRWRR